MTLHWARKRRDNLICHDKIVAMHALPEKQQNLREMIIMSFYTQCDLTTWEDNTVLICLHHMILNSSMSDCTH